MGGASSTRKITLFNDEESGVIEISDSVVKRLRGELDAASRKTSPVLSPTRQQHPLPQKPTQTSYEDSRAQTLRKNQDHDEEIRKLEAHWRSKLNAAEEQNNIVQNKMAEKFTAVVDEVGKMFPTSLCEPVCTEMQLKAQRCYEINPKTSLNCSKQVRDFSECVQQARLKMLNRG